uniref:Uncharacterized protein n=1 Tax=Globodera pallida TaxID=36090 RepID=A0A183BHZ7_GLOPA
MENWRVLEGNLPYGEGDRNGNLPLWPSPPFFSARRLLPMVIVVVVLLREGTNCRRRQASICRCKSDSRRTGTSSKIQSK